MTSARCLLSVRAAIVAQLVVYTFLGSVILRPLHDVIVHEKNEIFLECEFELPNLVAVWHKDDMDIFWIFSYP